MKRILSLLLLIIIIVGSLSGCAEKETSSDTLTTLEDCKSASIGIITGSSHDGTVKHYFPNAKRVYFNSLADMIIAVEQGKIDCYIEDAPFVTALIWEGVNLKCMDEAVTRVENGFVFPQGESTQLREQINSFLSEAKADGTIEQLKDKWLGAAEPEEHPDYRFNTQVEEFGRKHRISQRSIYNIQAFIEEMCVQIILPQLQNPFEMLVTIEYSEEHNDADVIIRYDGKAFDPTQTDNELSLLLAKKATAEIVYQYDPEQKLSNKVSAQI